MDTFRDFSGRHVLPIERFERPTTLAALRRAVLDAEQDDLPVHAMGQAWAFSAPAYCPGVVVDTRGLAGFPAWLQRAVIRPVRGVDHLVAVEAGIEVRALYTALDGRRPRLTPPTLGGAGKQTLGGVVSTGTHGGDVARPPISDFVRAIVLVGSGGVVRVIQHPDDIVVDFAALEPELRRAAGPGAVLVDDVSADGFDAALVSVGRFGVAYAYVFAARDESASVVVEHRTVGRWSDVRPSLLDRARAAAAADRFFQVVINPVPTGAGDRKCYVTEQALIPATRTGTAGDAFGIGPVASVPVEQERQAGLFPGSFGQALCADRLSPELAAIRASAIALGVWLIARHFPFGVVLAVPLFEAAASIGRIGAHHRLGDVLADLLNLATRRGRPEPLELLNGAVLDGLQSDRRGNTPGPWLVHGPRWRIADTFDYGSDCYRADSIEVFFPVDAALPAAIDEILAVFTRMRDAGTPIGAYLSIRFHARSRALLATAPFAPTCAVEVSVLRGLEGNTEALRLLHAVAVERRGRVHWGQWNDLPATTVADLYGDNLRRWRRALAEREGDSPTFANPFTVAHGLEPDRQADWAGWQPAGITPRGHCSVVPAAGGPLEVLAVDQQARVVRTIRTASASAQPWTPIREEAVDPAATPVGIRSADRRTEVFIRTDDRLKHTWQTAVDGPFAGWNTKGDFLGPGPRIAGDPVVVGHADHRLEAFAREFETGTSRLLHTWAHWVNSDWSALVPRGEQRITGQPTACLRRFSAGVGTTDQLIAVATTDDGGVVWTGQVGPDGRSDWTPWSPLHGMTAPGANPVAVEIFGPGLGAHVFVVDARGQVQEAVESNLAQAVGWQPWRPLPALRTGNRLDPAVRLTTTQPHSLWLFGVSVRRRVMAIEFTPGSGWGAWLDLGGDVVGGVAAGFLEDGRVEVFARRASDGALMARRQTTPRTW